MLYARGYVYTGKQIETCKEMINCYAPTWICGLTCVLYVLFLLMSHLVCEVVIFCDTFKSTSFVELSCPSCGTPIWRTVMGSH